MHPYETVYLNVFFIFFFFSSRRRHTRLQGDWSSDVCSSDIAQILSGLGFYIESLAHGKVDFEAAMQPLAAARKEEADAAQPVTTVEAQVAEQQRETASLYEEWKTKPHDGAIRAELKKNLAP